MAHLQHAGNRILSTFYAYVHTKPSGEPFYVGKGSGKRARELRTGRNAAHRRVVDEIGRLGVGVYVFPCVSEADAIETEAHWIAQLRAEGYDLVNMSTGGQCGATGCKRSAETLLKMSLSQRGRKFSQETLARMRAAHRPGNSPEACARQSLKIKGNKFRLGIPHTPETKAKIAVTSRGASNPQARISEETVIAIRKEYERVNNKAAVARAFGVSESQIGRIVSGEAWKHVQ